MKLDSDQRVFIADKLMDSANYALALLVLGQFVTDRLQPLLLLFGLVLYLWCWSVAIRFHKGVKKGVKS